MVSYKRPWGCYQVLHTIELDKRLVLAHIANQNPVILLGLMVLKSNASLETVLKAVVSLGEQVAEKV